MKKKPKQSLKDFFIYIMDDIGRTHKAYIKAYDGVLWFVFLVFSPIISWMTDQINVSSLSRFRVVELNFIQLLMVFLVSFCGYKLLCHLVTCCLAVRWRNINKKSWVKGKWLHIHEKDTIRIGIVNIEQNYNTIRGEGFNVTPDIEWLEAKEETNWNYLMGIVKDESDFSRDFWGYYSALDGQNGRYKDGVHVLQITGLDRNTGYANCMKGRFRDTFDVGVKDIKDIRKYCGQLFLFRMSSEFEEFLKNNEMDEKTLLKRICDNNGLPQSLKDDPFIKQLNISINNCKKAAEKKKLESSRT